MNSPSHPALNRIAYVATREPDYSRVSIVRKGLNQHFKVDEYLSELKSYKFRLFTIALRFVWASVTGRLRKCDAVFVGFFAQPIFPLVRLMYRGPIISDAYFSLYDTMVNDKQKVSASSWTGKLCFWLDRYMLRHSEMCITDTEQHVEYMKEYFDAPASDVRRVWISAESSALPTRRESVANHETLKVFFWGGFIPLQGIETIIRSAGILLPENVEFTLFGTGQTFDSCQELANRIGATNVAFEGWQTHDAINKQAAESHVALGIFGTTEKAGRVIPNKAYEALAMGIPLITRGSAASDELFLNDENCMLVPAGDPDALAEKILWVRNNYTAALAIADQGKSLFEEECSPQEIGKILKEEIDLLATRIGSSSTNPGIVRSMLGNIANAFRFIGNGFRKQVQE